nr:uncharacterized protein LOC123497627 [Aegilops tauschii subsp. strangulata]
MVIVVLLLHLTCFSQYALCGLNLGLTRSWQPPVGVSLIMSVAICASALANLYNNLTPSAKTTRSRPQDDDEPSSGADPIWQWPIGPPGGWMGTGACVLAGDSRAMGSEWKWSTGVGRSRNRQAAEQQSCNVVQEQGWRGVWPGGDGAGAAVRGQQAAATARRGQRRGPGMRAGAAVARVGREDDGCWARAGSQGRRRSRGRGRRRARRGGAASVDRGGERGDVQRARMAPSRARERRRGGEARAAAVRGGSHMAVAYRATRGLDGHGRVRARRRQQSDGSAWKWSTGVGWSRNRQAAEQQSCNVVQEQAGMAWGVAGRRRGRRGRARTAGRSNGAMRAAAGSGHACRRSRGSRRA